MNDTPEARNTGPTPAEQRDPHFTIEDAERQSGHHAALDEITETLQSESITEPDSDLICDCGHTWHRRAKCRSCACVLRHNPECTDPECVNPWHEDIVSDLPSLPADQEKAPLSVEDSSGLPTAASPCSATSKDSAGLEPSSLSQGAVTT